MPVDNRILQSITPSRSRIAGPPNKNRSHFGNRNLVPRAISFFLLCIDVKPPFFVPKNNPVKKSAIAAACCSMASIAPYRSQTFD